MPKAIRAVWIVGPGRMGLSLGALCLETALTQDLRFFGRATAAPGHPLLRRPGVSYAAGVSGPPPRDSLLVLAVPDATLAGVASDWAAAGPAPKGTVALHLSGALPSSVLEPLRARGYTVGALHPLQTVAAPDERGAALRGIAFAFEGETGARRAAEAIARAAGGRLFDVPAQEKAKYHAACVFAANYVVANAGVAARLLAQAASISEAQALTALLPLMDGALGNLSRVGLPRALTGPIARGDVEVVRRHLDALDAPTRVLYSAAAREALRLARSAGLDPHRADEIERVLDTQR